MSEVKVSLGHAPGVVSMDDHRMTPEQAMKLALLLKQYALLADGKAVEVAGPAAGTRGLIVPRQRKTCVNLGSGQRPFFSADIWDWINVDVQEKWHPNIVADGSNLRPHFQDESVDVVVLHHVLEHFGCGEADAMLKECYRILKHGGSLIVCVPNMRALAEAWLFTQWDEEHKQSGLPGGMCERALPPISTQIYLTNIYGAYHGDEADRHKWGYDRDSLVSRLKQAGDWEEIRDFDNRAIPGADLAADWWILSAECVK